MKTECAAVKTLWSWFPIVTPQGDGSFHVRPSKPVSHMSIKQSAAYLNISPSSVYRLVDEGVIPAERPLRGKILIAVSDLEAHKERSRDPEFWQRRN